MNTWLNAVIATGSMSLFFLSGAAWADDGINGADTLIKGEAEPGVHFRIHGGYDYQFKTNIDNGGNFRMHRAGAGLTARTEITPELDLRLLFGYEYARYDFGGDTSFAFGQIDPWDEIHTVSFGGVFSAALTNDWTVFGGPVMQFSRETDASWNDSFIGGGVFGTSFIFSDDLTLGGGLGVVSQIERSVRVFPVIIVDWQITNRLKLTSHTAATASGDTGLELVYDWGEGWETAIGGGHRFRRFRLDSGAPEPDGVGQERGLPFWVRITRHLGPHASINLRGGVTFEGDLRLEDQNGNRVARENHDPAPFVGISANIRF